MKLIIIDGPSGVGKSTLAERLHSLMPLSLLLDIDAQRRLLSHYREHRQESYDLSFAFCFAAAETHLKNGHDVIIDKYISDTGEKLGMLKTIGEKCGADIFEFILNASKETVLKRAHERGFKEGGLLTPERVEAFWHDIQGSIGRRPQAHVINTDEASADEVFKEASQILGLTVV